MKKVIIIILSFAFFAHSLMAQNYKDPNTGKSYRINRGYKGAEKEEKTEESLRPGMEIKKIGGITAIVPEGSEIYEESGIFHLETPEEYAARKFKAMGERFEKAEKRLYKLENRIEELEEDSEGIEERLGKLEGPLQE